MHAVTICLVLLSITCGASLLSRVVKLPLPFLQIGLGVGAALPPFSMQVELDPHAFILLFIPPLLFGDGWSMPRRALLALRWPLLGHAVGLVLLTVVAGGYGLHWLIPDMPLSVAFAVAALVSPTDAVAVSAITARIKVPARMMHLLESEALLNDASGLVAMRVAVAATLSGTFFLPAAAGTFVLVAAGGLAVGWALTLVYDRLHRLMLVRADDAILQTVLSALLPYAAYVIAEQLDVSGILAAVAAGITASRVSMLERAHFSARLQSGFTWSVIRFSLNGTIFVLLGLQLPGIVGSGSSGINLLTSDTRLTVLGEIAALTTTLIVIRFVWVLASILFGRLLRQSARRPGWRVVAASSLAGVRGAITLAGVLGLPLLMPDNTPFPSRDLAITLATGVILCSMLIAAVALPLLLRDAPVGGHNLAQEKLTARIAANKAAMLALVAGEAAPTPHAKALIDFYRQQLIALQEHGSDAGMEEFSAWHDLHRVALQAEREAVQALRGAGDIDDTVARQLLGELDLLEAALTQRPFRLAQG